jgi:hypothetical protein
LTEGPVARVHCSIERVDTGRSQQVRNLVRCALDHERGGFEIHVGEPIELIVQLLDLGKKRSLFHRISRRTAPHVESLYGPLQRRFSLLEIRLSGNGHGMSPQPPPGAGWRKVA